MNWKPVVAVLGVLVAARLAWLAIDPSTAIGVRVGVTWQPWVRSAYATAHLMLFAALSGGAWLTDYIARLAGNGPSYHRLRSLRRWWVASLMLCGLSEFAEALCLWLPAMIVAAAIKGAAIVALLVSLSLLIHARRYLSRLGLALAAAEKAL